VQACAEGCGVGRKQNRVVIVERVAGAAVGKRSTRRRHFEATADYDCLFAAAILAQPIAHNPRPLGCCAGEHHAERVENERLGCRARRLRNRVEAAVGAEPRELGGRAHARAACSGTQLA